MKSPKAFLLNSASAVVLLSVTALVLGIGVPGAKQANRITTQNKTPRIQNQTRAFEVLQTSDLIQTRANDDSVRLSLRNGYDKRITAFALLVNGAISMTDFIYSQGEDQRGIIPESVYTEEFAFARPGGQDTAAQQSLAINVLAVVFDDKSSDGDTKSISAILNARRESKTQLTSIVRSLNKALDSLGGIDKITLDRLKTEILSIPINSPFSNEKEDVLRRLDQPDNPNPRETLLHLKATCESLLARL
jgi:hypothetical protein